ncbi:hypothetical protein V5O48_007448 [Marasmius crinis-equi]|uniref:Rho-GAP domain-containing protein n=1 Tax=Marasmius crinis-equi TaxID=585013 RepID=A0ABR3FGR9_9AGAR
MLFPRRGSAQDPDPYTPVPTQSLRARREDPLNTSSNTLSPPRKRSLSARVRAASLPSNGRPVTKISIPDLSQSKPSSPTNASTTPSRLPRLQPRRVHQKSVSLSVPRSGIPRPSTIRATAEVTRTKPPTPPRHNTFTVKSRHFIKHEPLIVVQHLRSLLILDGLEWSDHLHIDDLVALHEREMMEVAHRLKQYQSKNRQPRCSQDDDTLTIFGTTLRQASLYASAKAILGGHEHDLPIVVFACVEELYRRGPPTLNALPVVPKPSHRLEQLIRAYDSPLTRFGSDTHLENERLEDVYGLLAMYLSRLPEPVFAPYEIARGLKSALLAWCLSASDAGIQGPNQIKIAQLLLRLLPAPHLSLFVYLMAFVCQIRAQDRLGIPVSLGSTFGRWLFGRCGDEGKAAAMMMWFIHNWGEIIITFFDELPALSSSTRKSHTRPPIIDHQATPKVLQDVQAAARSPVHVSVSLPSEQVAYAGGRDGITPSGSAIKVGMVQTQSYGYLTENSTEASRTASFVDLPGSLVTAAAPASPSGTAQSVDDDNMSRCSSGSAQVNERLLDNVDDAEHIPSFQLPQISLPCTPITPTNRHRTRIPKPKPKSRSDSHISESGSESASSSSCYSTSSRMYSPESKLEETWKSVLRVVNTGDDNLLLSPTSVDDDERLYTGKSRDDDDRVYALYPTSSSDSSSDPEEAYGGLAKPSPPSNKRSDGRGRVAVKLSRGVKEIDEDLGRFTNTEVCCQCKNGCPTRVLMRELRERLALVERERDEAVERARILINVRGV